MADVNATLCLPFRPAEQTITVLTQTVLEACKRTCFPYEQETADLLGEVQDVLELLLSANLIETISVDFGLARVHVLLRSDAQPEEEDELDMELLDLVLEAPATCVITLTLRDPDKAAYLSCLDLESASTAHISLVLEPPSSEDTEEGDY